MRHLKTSSDSKYGEIIGTLLVIVPLFAFALYIDRVSWQTAGVILAALLAIVGASTAASALASHGSKVRSLRGIPALAFWGSLIVASICVVLLWWLKEFDVLAIGGFGFTFICVLLLIGRWRAAGDA